MSALSNPAPSPVEKPPPQPVSPLVSPQLPGGRSPWKRILFLAVLAGGAWLTYQLSLKPQNAARQAPAVASFRTARVVVGPFERVIRLSGQTAAKQYANVSAPRMRGFESRSQMELLQLVKNGSWVKKDDLLAQIDPGTQSDHVDDLKATIIQSESDIKKRKAEQSVEFENLQQTLRLAKSQADKARLDNQAAEVRTDIERELLKLSMEEADARHNQAGLDLPFKKTVHEAEVKILGYTTERHVRHVNRHINDINSYTINSPMEGLAVLQSIYRGGGESHQVQQGDQLGSGQPLMRVVNPGSMQVDASVNQAASTEIRIGQRATIGLDAFPGLTLKGRVYSMGALAMGGYRPGYYIRTVAVRLNIEGADSRLIPDLSAHADVVVESQEKTTLVPLGAIVQESNKSYVYVRQGGEFVKREVTLGPANNLYAVASAGLRAGEEVRLR
ncbi:MAG: HlyD family efflux transporter periplasmic adaptor subunit [Acidobacteria bacterium]|nr:HlyD family efflux transporter periplasmic adaptor subunit [Acidobacteriota bacterium]